MLSVVIPYVAGLASQVGGAVASTVIKKAAKDVASKGGSKSLAEYSGILRSEPICMIDKAVEHNEYIEDIMKTACSIYTAMYAQAFSIGINETVGDIKVTRVLDSINPNRSKKSVISSLLTLDVSNEHLALKLPTFSKTGLERVSMESTTRVTQRKRTDHEGNVTTEETTEVTQNSPHEDKVTGSKVDTEAITKFASNLSTGVVFDLTFRTAERDVTFPAVIQLMANVIETSNVDSLMTAAVTNRTMRERWHDWRAGAIDFWKDAVLCRDLIEEHRRNLIKDKSGIFQEVYERGQKNTTVGILTLNPTIAQVTNILVVSSDTIRNFEQRTGKQLKNNKIRQLLFENTKVMIMIVVDQDRETATFHYHSINVPTVATLRSLKGAAKSNLADMTSMMKSLQMGNGIRF